MHWHIPAFIIGALRKRKPGFFLMRNPFDCVASWTIFWEGKIGLTDALDYYLDFHQALMPFRDELFIVTFEEAVTQFPGVLRRFNHRFSTGYLAAPPSEIFFNRCIADVENSFREADGSVNEFSVARPSAVRSNLKIALAEEVCSSKTMRRKLDQAEALWRHFRGAGGGSVRPALFSQRLSLDLQDR